MTDLFFCPERWEPDEAISTNVADRIQVRGWSGRSSEAWQLGDWNGNWTAIVSEIPIEPGWLEAGGNYRFCFWLNGGENSRADETCALEIFGDSWEERLRFPLNRNRTRPLLEKNGWLLFAIPFTAPETAGALTFRFTAAGAVCTVAGIPDMDMSVYESVTSDPHDSTHPQRHNIVFPDGWPPDNGNTAKKTKGRARPAAIACIAALAAGAAICTCLAVRKLHKKQK